MSTQLFWLVLGLGLAPAKGQLAAMVEGMINYYRGQGAADIMSIMAQPRSDQCEWSAWNQCVWPAAGGDGQLRSDKYLDQLGSTCQRHWFYRLIRSRYSDSLNNVFQYTKNAMAPESKRAPCGMCSYRQSCGYNGRERCHKPFLGIRPNVVPLHIKEQLCSLRRGLSKPQAEPCQMLRSVLQWNNPRNPCQIWPAAKRNLRLPDLSPIFQQQLESIKLMRCVADSLTRRSSLRVPGSPFNGRRFPNRCRCCCFPYEPKLRRRGGRRDWICGKMDLSKIGKAPAGTTPLRGRKTGRGGSRRTRRGRRGRGSRG